MLELPVLCICGYQDMRYHGSVAYGPKPILQDCSGKRHTKEPEATRNIARRRL
jgi:hypothetical protein